MSCETVSDERLAKFVETRRTMGDAGDGARYAWWDDLTVALTELQSLRSKPVAGVEVKPLGDWRRGYCDERVQIQQQSFGGLYQVRVLDGVVWLDWPNRTAEEFPNVQLAKESAEADYRQRILSTLSLPAQEPVAWEGYWPGAGSIDSVTRLTSYRPTMEKWKADEAEITPLYASPQPEAVITEEMVERALARSRGNDLSTLTNSAAMREILTAALEAAVQEG